MSLPFLGAAIAVETRKAAASRTLRATMVLVASGIAILSGSFALARSDGSGIVAAKLALLVHGSGWAGFFEIAEQITAAGVLLAFGIGMTWMLGREFLDHTVSGLFALPVPLRSIALAKLVVALSWCALVTLLTVAALAVVGLALGFGLPDGDALLALAREAALCLLTALLSVPCAWAATLSRGLLAGIGTAVGLVVSAQVAVVAGIGEWWPGSAPALWAVQPDAIPAGALALVAVVPLVFGALTIAAWSRLELDR
jgi:ABC-2 type transport system permease protein